MSCDQGEDAGSVVAAITGELAAAEAFASGLSGARKRGLPAPDEC